MLNHGGRLLRRLKRGLAAPDPKRLRLDLERQVEARTSALQATQAELRATNRALVTLARELEARVAQRTEEARREKEAAVRATEAKSMFLATMSHELRTPLNVVLGYCHLAAHTFPLSSQQSKYLGQIQTASHTLLRLVNDNLDLSKIEAGAFAVARAPVRLGPLCQELTQLVRRKAEEKGLSFRIEWAPEVPEAILGDSARLLQVLLNLVDNALKFTQRGKVRLCLTMEPEGLHFRVRDTGAGLDARQRANLFTPFAQFHDPRDGSGLGLALSRRLVDLMGGRLALEGPPGKGSIFGFTLPTEALPAALPRTGPTALVVEPLAALRRNFLALLRPFVPAFQTVASLGEAETRLEALKAAGAPGPDFIFLPHGAPRLQRRHGVPARSLVYRVRPGKAQMAEMALMQGWIHGFLVVPADSVRLLDLLLDGRKPAQPSPRFAGRPRLLLVEDSPVNRMMTRELLEQTGIRVVEAGNGRQALQAVQTERPFDAILMDLELPDMSGLEVAARIRAGGAAATPILALTAHTLQAERGQSLEAGMNGFLSKPVEPDLLYQTLQAYLPAAREPPLPVPQSINWPAFQSRVQGRQELTQRVLAQFRRELKALGAALRSAMDQGDLAAVMAQAHTLAGAAANLAAEPVHLAARRLQQSPSAANLRIVERAVQSLKEELDDLDQRPSAPPQPGEVDLARLDGLLARNSLEACGDLQAMVERLRCEGRAEQAEALRTALEGLDFPGARRLLAPHLEP